MRQKLTVIATTPEPSRGAANWAPRTTAVRHGTIGASLPPPPPTLDTLPLAATRVTSEVLPSSVVRLWAQLCIRRAASGKDLGPSATSASTQGAITVLTHCAAISERSSGVRRP